MAGRTLIETPEYTHSFNQLGDPSFLDDALVSLTASISENPDSYPIIPTFRTLRMAVTESYTWPSGSRNGLFVIFRTDGTERVLMLWIGAIVLNED